ncbi:hypothetical protein [Entomohabitans teleogrylli]|uniref:hypothetical protein n=1 Tax=Entomohabitans teleogrylli TaxID=1384589 RepID=UPI00073D9CF8|nr:hypothetical protein [Entomohabitans teleogrylli]
MATVSGLIEGAFLIGGTPYQGVALATPNQNVVCKSSPVNLVHSGENAYIYDDIIGTSEEREQAGGFYPGSGSMISSTGFDSTIYAGNASRTSALNDNSAIDIGYMEEVHPDWDIITDSHAYTAGYNARIHARENVSDSTLVSAGVNSLVFDDGENNVVVLLGENSSASPGENSLLFSAHASSLFSLEKNGAAAIAWFDGQRRRITVVYEGEDDILAGLTYYIDHNGQVVEV